MKARSTGNSPGKKQKPSAQPRARLPRWIREGLGLALMGLAGFLLLSLLSYDPESDPGFFRENSPPPRSVHNLGGPVGSYTASFLKETVGLASYGVVALVAGLAVLTIGGKRVRMTPWKVPPGVVILLAISALASLLLPHRPVPQQGGIIGHFLGSWLLESLHPVGSYLLLYLLLAICIIAVGETALLRHLSRFAAALLRPGRALAMALSRGAVRLLGWLGEGVWQAAAFLRARGRALAEQGARARERIRKSRAGASPRPPSSGTVVSMPEPFAPRGPAVPDRGQPDLPAAPAGSPRIVDPPQGGEAPQAASPAEKRKKTDPGPRQGTLPFPGPLPLGYRPPPLELLDDPEPGKIFVDQEALLRSASVLEQKLRDFGIQGKVTEIHPGPIITLFEYEPAPGIKVNRIVNLSDDLALAMKAMSVRIVAPIPGKSVVGIEVPNADRQVVFLKEILGSGAFQSKKNKLPLVLGKDIAGKPVATDLSRMPHLLIAGATGTGKSVCLHSLILSLLFRFSPEEVKFLMIDPKMLELSAYHGIPHLMHPVITDARRAQDALDWAVERMEQRYQLLAEKGVRNIEKYNERIEQELAGRAADWEEEPPGPEPPEAGNPEDEFLPEQGKLPYIILVIDEMADLMIVSGRQIEESITRLAQMARAAGIHLLLATQRPSVDVLTGIIKANLPTRISFQVSSRIDSRTILDSIGAEKLLGQGDMLFLPPGTSMIRRIHGAYITEPEIERVVEFLKQHGKPSYARIPYRSKKTGKNKDEPEAFEDDEKYDLAVQLVTDTRQASISMIQRKLRVGYNRAARMIERMEQEGIVGPQEGVKPREVLANQLD